MDLTLRELLKERNATGFWRSVDGFAEVEWIDIEEFPEYLLDSTEIYNENADQVLVHVGDLVLKKLPFPISLYNHTDFYYVSVKFKINRFLSSTYQIFF